MNPDSPLASPPASTHQTHLPKSGWKQRLSNLNRPQRLIVLAAAVLAVLLITLAIYQLQKEEAPAPPPPAAVIPSAQVSITSSGFTPATIAIKAGTQIIWTDNDTAPHQIAADPHPKHDSIPGFDSTVTLLAGDSFAFTFETKDTYTYHDHLNPLDPKYRGTVIVE